MIEDKAKTMAVPLDVNSHGRIVAKKYIIDGISPAPVLRQLHEQIKIARRLDHVATLFGEAISRGTDQKDFFLSRGISEDLRRQGLMRADNIYYMLYPKNVSTLVQKYNKPINVINTAVSSSLSINPHWQSQDPVKKMFGVNTVVNFKKALNGDKKALELLGNHTVTMADLETIGSGMDKNGISSFHGIYDYSLVNIDGNGHAKKFTGLIGVDQTSETGKFLDSISESLSKGEKLTKDQEVAYNFISRLGASTDYIKEVDGRFISTQLTDSKQSVYQTVDNFSKGKEKLFSIHKEQVKKYGSMGGYKQLVDDLIEVYKNPTTLMGWNTNAFDIFRLKDMGKVAPGVYEYAAQQGFDLRNISNDTFDLLEQARNLPSSVQSKLREAIYPNGIDAVNPGGTAFQAESIFKGLFGLDTDGHHSALTDTIQQLKIAGFDIDENGSVSFKNNPFISTIIDNAEETAEEVYNKQHFTVLPKKGGGLPSLWDNQNMFVSMQDGNNIYFSNGVSGTIKDGKFVVDQEASPYTPGAWDKRTAYIFNSDTIEELNASDLNQDTLDYFKKFRPEMRAESEKFIKIQMTPRINYERSDSVYSKSQKTITMLIPESDFDKVMKDQFDVIEYGGTNDPNEMPELKNTVAGERIKRSAYSKISPVDTKPNIASYASDVFASSTADKVADNANRRLLSKGYKTLEKGLALQLVAAGQAAPEEFDSKIGDFNKALDKLFKDPNNKNAEEFLNIVGGAKLSKQQETFVTNAIGKNWRADINTWLNSWSINGKHTSGWLDNSKFFMINTKADSLMGRYLIGLGGGKHSWQQNDMINSMFGYFKDYVGQKAIDDIDAIYPDATPEFKRIMAAKMQTTAMGVNVIEDTFRADNGIRQYTVPMFMKRHLSKGTDLSSAFIRLNLDNPYSAYNSFFNAIKLNKEDYTEDQLKSIINDFSASLRTESFNSENIYNKKLRRKINKALLSIENDQNLSAKDKFLKITDVLNLNTKDISGFKPMTSYYAPSSSFAMSKSIGEEEAAKVINGAQSRLNEAFNDSNRLDRFLFGSSKKTAIKNYEESIANKLSGEEYRKSMFLFNKHLDDAQKYAGLVGKSIKDAGGTMYEDNGRIYASFKGHDPIDISSSIPRIKYNSGITYIKYGNSSWTSGVQGKISSNGIWQVSSSIEAAKNKLSGLGKALKEAIIMEQRPEDVLQKRLSIANKAITDKDNLPSSSIKTDYRVSNTLVYKDAILDPENRKELISFLESKSAKNETAKKFADELRKFDSEKYKEMPDFARKGIAKLIDDGILPATFELKNGNITEEFHLNADLKDTQMESRFGISDITYGAEAATRNYATSAQYVDEASVFTLKSRLGDRNVQEGVVTDFDKMVEDINGIGVSNKIGVKAMDINTKIRDELISKYQASRGVFDLETDRQMKRLVSRINPIEGGAVLAGSVFDQMGYVPGTKAMDLTHKEVLNRSDIAKTKDSFSITYDADGNKQINYSYGKGFFVKDGENYLRSFSNYDVETDESVKKASAVTQKYFLGEGKNMAVSDTEVLREVLQYADKNGIEINSESDFRKIADHLFSKKLVATPITLDNSIKTKMGLSEKQMTELLYETIGETTEENSHVRKAIDIIAETVKDNTGVDIKNQVLEKSVFDDLVSGKLSNPAFDALSDEQKKAFRKALSNNGVAEDIKFGRYALEDLMERIFGNGVNFLSKSMSDSYKHGFESAGFETLVTRLRERVKNGSMSKEDFASELSKIITGDNVKINTNTLDIEVGNGLGYELNAKELNEALGKYMPKAGEIYNTYIGVQNVPTVMNKAPKLDDRTLRTLMNKVFDKDNLSAVRQNMDAFDSEAFRNVFGELLNENNDIDLSNPEYQQGRSIWATEAFNRNMRSNTFFNGEHVFEEIQNPTDPRDIIRNKIYHDTVKGTDGAIVSKEFVEDMLHAKDVQDAQNIESELYTKKLSGAEADKVFDEYGFKAQKYRDVKWDYTNNRLAYKKDADALWKNNTVVDLYDESLGLDEKFFRQLDEASDESIINEDSVVRKINESNRDIQIGKGVRNPNSRYIVLPAHDAFAGEGISSKDIGRAVNLTDPQAKAQTLFRHAEELRNLIRRQAEDSENKGIYDENIGKLRDKIRQDYVSYKKSWDNYTKHNGKEGTVFGKRVNTGRDLARRTTAYVFDTNTWKHNGLDDRIDPFNNLQYSFGGKDYKLRDFYEQGNEVAFAVASTKDLEKYGFDKKFFDNLHNEFGVTKKEWLENAKTYGIDVFAHRDPNDYHLSTNSAKLYFSDYVPEDSIKVSSALAYAMKQDADGDNVTMLANMIRLKNGNAVDTSFIDILMRKNNGEIPKELSELKEVQDALSLRKTHEMDRAMTSFGEFNSEQYRNAYLNDYLDSVDYNNTINKKRKALLDAPSNIIYAQSKAYLDPKQAETYMNSWETAKKEIRSLVEENAQILGLSSESIKDMTDYGFVKYGNALLDNKNINMADWQNKTIKQGLSSFNRMKAPIEANMAKIMRSSTGTMDTPFTVINRLGHALRSSEVIDVFGEAAEGLRITDQDIKLLDFMQEAAKEGFLSAKNNEGIMSDEKMMSLAKQTQEKINDMIHYRNSAKGDQAANELVDILNKYGKQKVIDRNNVASMLGEDVLKQIEEKARAQGRADFEKIKQEMIYNESIQRAVGSMRNVISRLNDKAAQGGLFELHASLTDYVIHEILQGRATEEHFNYLKDTGLEENLNQYKRATKEMQENIQDVIRNGNMAQQMKRLKRLDISDSIRAARSSIGQQSGHGWAKNVMMLAGSIMFAGFVGGNPAAPSGSEAQSMQQQPQQQYMSPIPPQSDFSLNSMRNGPKQGYIININGAAGNPNMRNDQIGQAISKAVTDNYNNSQININIKTQDRSDISYDQVYNYMEQSLF